MIYQVLIVWLDWKIVCILEEIEILMNLKRKEEDKVVRKTLLNNHMHSIKQNVRVFSAKLEMDISVLMTLVRNCLLQKRGSVYSL